MERWPLLVNHPNASERQNWGNNTTPVTINELLCFISNKTAVMTENLLVKLQCMCGRLWQKCNRRCKKADICSMQISLCWSRKIVQRVEVNQYVLHVLKLKTTATVLCGHPTTAAAIFALHVSVGNDLEQIGSRSQSRLCMVPPRVTYDSGKTCPTCINSELSGTNWQSFAVKTMCGATSTDIRH